MSAQACACQPQPIHKTLLTRKTQKPALRRRVDREATSQAASSEAAKAGHCSKSSMSALVCPLGAKCEGNHDARHGRGTGVVWDEPNVGRAQCPDMSAPAHG